MFAAIMSTYSLTTRRAYDEAIIGRTNEQARLALDLIGYDLRMAGAGVPLGQGGFAPGGAGLGDAPMPILTSSTATNIVMRLNETGRVGVLTSQFTPSMTSLTFQVHSSADIAAGDMVYLSNATAGGTLGLKGTVQSVSGNSVTLETGYITSAGAVFDSGSVVHRVTQITYDSPAAGTGITRDNVDSLITVVPNSTFSLTYYDAAGSAIPLPLTAAIIQNQLCSVQVSTSVVSTSKLRNGSNYTATAVDRIALRNLILSR